MSRADETKSTIDRAGIPLPLPVLRTTFQLLERAAPWAGARIMARIWSTPLGASAARKHDNRPRPGTLTTLPLTAARTVAAESWGSAGSPVVYLLHGWGGWRGQLGAFVQPLLDNGFQVVAVDAPSHGDSGPGRWGPRQSLIPEFTDALEAAIKAYGPAHAVIAHSLGAAATTFGIAEGMAVSRVAMIAPSVDLDSRSRELGAVLGYGEKIRTGFLRQIERRAGRPIADFDMPARARHLKNLPPALFVHDRADYDVPYTDGEQLAAAWGECEFVSTEGLGHRRILTDPAVVAHTVAFACAQLVPAQLDTNRQ